MLFVTNDVKLNIFSGNLHSSLTKWIPVCKYPDKVPLPPCLCQTCLPWPAGCDPDNLSSWCSLMMTSVYLSWIRMAWNKRYTTVFHSYSVLVLDNFVIFKNLEIKLKVLCQVCSHGYIRMFNKKWLRKIKNVKWDSSKSRYFVAALHATAPGDIARHFYKNNELHSICMKVKS